ncbi:uncharacterized membrane-anchored protein YhcB (DUF1043 family) [Streptosporangium album]|uniref:Uncharacterized membrane-anchored protein YhcB (DUF1043 family) n=1 Tax=Streptosporangium album TaxID=47479 RepID=A0A7W7WBX1_9ACTN|nr:hypothetical protein [Streptosporangium album]MBB4941233.1 uncharacterized membrane-anchored protein YhcB (DUF1043 family) [Streptosporangium album]
MGDMLRKVLSRLLDISDGLAIVCFAATGVFSGIRLLGEHQWIPEWVGGLLLALALGAIGVAIRFLWRRQARRLAIAEEDPGQRLRHRIQSVNSAFAEATTLMDELRRDLEAQQAARETLLVEAEQQQRLLEINTEEAEKIRQILVGETKATIRAERRREWMFFLFGFLASAAASVPIGLWVNHIS